MFEIKNCLNSIAKYEFENALGTGHFGSQEGKYKNPSTCAHSHGWSMISLEPYISRFI